MDVWWLGFAAGVMAGIFAGLFIFTGLTNDEWQDRLINRGMAQYCPDTGEWAFKGECEE